MNPKLNEPITVDSFVDVTNKTMEHYRLYKLQEFSNKEYGIAVTEYKTARISGKEVIKSFDEQIVAYGTKEKITSAFEMVRERFIHNPQEAYAKLLEISMKKFDLREGDVLIGTVKNVQSVVVEGIKKADVLIEIGERTLKMKVSEEAGMKFQAGHKIEIKNTSDGLQANIISNLANRLKM